MKGIVVREGAVEVGKVKRYAEKNKMPFIDLRQGLTFANVEQLNQNLSIMVSNAFRRPLRADINTFFKGECLGKSFAAVVPNDFVNDFMETTMKSPKDILEHLSENESFL